MEKGKKSICFKGFERGGCGVEDGRKASRVGGERIDGRKAERKERDY